MLRVKSICKEQGITLKELAKRMNISPEALSRLVSENGNPTLSTLGNVAKALGVEVYELLDDFSADMLVRGYLEINGKIFRIHNFKELQEVYKNLPQEKNQSDSEQSK
jgi:transcriptional regulator with XRE-family HTH domain